mgnify:CR=1 FL=1
MIRIATVAAKLALVGVASVIAGFYFVTTLLTRMPSRDVPRAS